VGWQVEPKCLDGLPPYFHLTKNGHTVGGLVLRPGPHVPPHFLGFVSVLDVEGAIERAREHRAAVLVPAMQTALGRAAVIQDPQGAVVGLCRRASGDTTDGDRRASGVFCWSQLRSSDADSAANFYGKVLGWQRVSLPAKGDLSAFMQDDRTIAGLLQAPQGTFAQWLIHVSVESLERSRAIAKGLGGTIMVERIAHPGLGHVSVIQDNVGTILALFEAEATR
jgi:predicted enzyme related to lactoylglutathione lyase